MRYYFILASIFLITNINCINQTNTTIPPTSNSNLDKELNYQLLIQPDDNSSLNITHLNNDQLIIVNNSKVSIKNVVNN
jgi:hypothetical protein